MKLMSLRRKEQGFTLIELLIVVAIIGILAAIAIPNLLNALQRGKQKGTMANIRNLATAIESYNVDNNQYPTAASLTCPTPLPSPDKTLDSASWTLLKPTYIAVPPFQDGWNHEMVYGVGTANQSYTVASKGRAGTATVPAAAAASCGTTTNFNDAIVYSDGTFVVYPEGPQQ